jgi:hypothetical protein
MTLQHTSDENPFHSQDSRIRFTPLTQQTPYESENHSTSTTSTENDFDMTGWTRTCSNLECCALKCLQLTPPEFLTQFKTKYCAMCKQESDIFIKGILMSCQTYSANNSRRTFQVSNLSDW